MGTETRYRSVRDVATEQELRVKWRTIQEDDEYERGHDPYNGALTQAHLTVSSKSFKTYKEAVIFADKTDLDKGQAVAYKYGEKAGFPRTKADFELVVKIVAMQKELDSFHADILKRFLDSKSSSKKCSHCDSVISQKSRKNVHAYAHGKAASVLERRSYGEVTDCPACGGNLLVTDTDKNRLISLTNRHQTAAKKQQEALAAAKKTSPEWGYYIVAAVPS